MFSRETKNATSLSGESRHQDQSLRILSGQASPFDEDSVNLTA